jgi:replicative DNA helicase
MSEELSFQGDGSDRLPPQSIEAEEAILGGILLDPEAVGRVRDRLVPEAFYINAHRDIYQAALTLHAQSKPTDLLTITSWLTDNDKLTRIGGRNKLATLIDRTVSAVNIDALAELVIEKYQRRQIIKAGNEIVQLGYETQTELPEILERVDKKASDIALGSKAGGGLTHIADTLVDAFQEVETRSQGLVLPGVSCGFYDLDAMSRGFQRSDLIIVAARPSIGKTAFALNIANFVSAAKLPTAIFSLEMSKEQLVQRLLASETGIESGLLSTGRISNTQWESLSRAIALLSESPIYIDDTALITLNHVRSECRKLQKIKGELGLVVIDYLQLMSGSGDDDVRELSRITRGLKQLARELNVPVIALSQLNRGVESRTNKRPMLSDLRQSGSIEQDADLVMMLYRDEYYNPDTPDRGIAEVIVAKHRNGPTGTVKLLFDPQYTKFRNLARVGDY